MSRNLETMFKVRNVPSDSGLRKGMDELDPSTLHPALGNCLL
ncbi:MAG: hypothetical protein OXE59_10670 [Bacteroidetes bacterium]|nr:hypothetical protein [Bacteroidota bacterium]